MTPCHATGLGLADKSAGRSLLPPPAVAAVLHHGLSVVLEPQRGVQHIVSTATCRSVAFADFRVVPAGASIDLAYICKLQFFEHLTASKSFSCSICHFFLLALLVQLIQVHC